ncbi:MAG: ABC transporter permease, partial [Pirellulaceae bacterium]
MAGMAVLGLVPTWISSWLTPIWLLGVGAIGALLLLAALWVVAMVLSRIPALSALADNPTTRNRAALVASVLAFVLLSFAAYSAGMFGDSAAPGGLERADAQMLVVLLALKSVIVGFAVITLMSRRAVDEAGYALREGPLWPIFILTLVLAGFGIGGYFIVVKPAEKLASLWRLPSAGTTLREFTITAAPAAVLDDPSRDPPQQPIAVDFYRSELQQLTLRSNQNLTIDVRPSEDLDLNPLFKISSNEDFVWTKSSKATSPFSDEHITQLYVRNYGGQDATLQLTQTTTPVFPEISTIPITAVAIAGLFLIYMLQRAVLPKVSAVALSTLKSEMAQPLFMIILIVGIVAEILFIFLPYNTLGEDIKVLKDSGMTLIMVLGIIQAIWAASTSISDEIDGRTALTVLSKPIGRRSFIIGKYLGIFWTVAVIFLVLGLVFMVVVAYKPIFDAKENSQVEEEAANWQVCHFEMVGVVPGLVLAFLETIVLAALSVAVSTRLPMLANFVICFTIYVLGHLTPLIVQSSIGKFAPVQFVAELLSAVLPILDHFNITAAVATGVTVPY